MSDDDRALFDLAALGMTPDEANAWFWWATFRSVWILIGTRMKAERSREGAATWETD